MLELHVPTEFTVAAVASVVGYLTDGLDAVVRVHNPSKLYEGSLHLKLAGNSRDLAIAAERATKLGGVVD